MTDLQLGSVARGGTDVAGDLMVADILVANDAGISVDDYCALRCSGANHDEALEIAASPRQVHGYVLARAAGITHDDALTAISSNMALGDVARALEMGCDFQTLADILGPKNGCVLAVIGLWDVCADLQELSWAIWHFPLQTRYYVELRENGVEWSEVMDVVARKFDVELYLEMRKRGLKHRSAIRATRVAM
jgi:hypothetical protein